MATYTHAESTAPLHPKLQSSLLEQMDVGLSGRSVGRGTLVSSSIHYGVSGSTKHIQYSVEDGGMGGRGGGRVSAKRRRTRAQAIEFQDAFRPIKQPPHPVVGISGPVSVLTSASRLCFRRKPRLVLAAPRSGKRRRDRPRLWLREDRVGQRPLLGSPDRGTALPRAPQSMDGLPRSGASLHRREPPNSAV